MKILVVDRGSLSSDTYTPSRSVFCRVYEPLSYLRQISGQYQYEVKQVNEIDESILKNYQAIVFCKHNTAESLAIARLAKKNHVKIIYDIDDIIHRVATDSAAFKYIANYDYLKEHMEIADTVVSSTKVLENVIKEDFCLQSSVVIRTGFNTDKYFKKSYDNSAARVLYTNGDNIKVNAFRQNFIELFNQFLKQNPAVEFSVFGDSQAYFNDFERYEFLGSLPWDKHKEWLMCNDSRFAIVPLGSSEENEVHHLFSDCKTPIKYLEYGAMKIPTIFSRASIYMDVVKDKETGLLVDNAKDSWEEALSEINRNDSLRSKIANNAYDDIAANHHIEKMAKEWREIL